MLSVKDEIYLEEVALQAMPILMQVLRPKDFSLEQMDDYAADVALYSHMLALDMWQRRNDLFANLPEILDAVKKVEEAKNAGK